MNLKVKNKKICLLIKNLEGTIKKKIYFCNRENAKGGKEGDERLEI